MEKNSAIRAARAKKGLTQEELAALMGVSRHTIIHWENGKTEPSVKEVEQLSKLLDTSSEELTLDEPKDLDSVYRKIVEGGTEYYLIPKMVFQEKYILVALDQFNKEQAKWDQDKAAFNKLLELFEKALGDRESQPKTQGAKHT